MSYPESRIAPLEQRMEALWRLVGDLQIQVRAANQRAQALAGAYSAPPAGNTQTSFIAVIPAGGMAGASGGLAASITTDIYQDTSTGLTLLGSYPLYNYFPGPINPNSTASTNAACSPVAGTSEYVVTGGSQLLNLYLATAPAGGIPGGSQTNPGTALNLAVQNIDGTSWGTGDVLNYCSSSVSASANMLVMAIPGSTGTQWFVVIRS